VDRVIFDAPGKGANVGGRGKPGWCGCPAPHHPVERTAHRAGFVVIPGPLGCGPPLTGGVIFSRLPVAIRINLRQLRSLIYSNPLIFQPESFLYCVIMS
jgi:hypothetical protein